MVLTRTAYDPNSPEGAVRACLQGKIAAVGTIAGIGPHSCCSFISYVRPSDGVVDNVLGNSRLRVPYAAKATGAVANACVHGELAALWNAIEDCNGVPQILEMYVEMSPCVNCEVALRNLLPPGTVVLYSFAHPADVAAWQAAATNLCR